jgi:transposase
MSSTGARSKPTSRRYSPQEKEQAVRMVRALREELGTSQGTVKRVGTARIRGRIRPGLGEAGRHRGWGHAGHHDR